MEAPARLFVAVALVQARRRTVAPVPAYPLGTIRGRGTATLLTARHAAYVLGTLGLLLNGFTLAYGLRHFGVPWQLTVGVLAADIVLSAPLAARLWRRSRHKHS